MVLETQLDFKEYLKNFPNKVNNTTAIITMTFITYSLQIFHTSYWLKTLLPLKLKNCVWSSTCYNQCHQRYIQKENISIIRLDISSKMALALKSYYSFGLFEFGNFRCKLLWIDQKEWDIGTGFLNLESIRKFYKFSSFHHK